MTLNMTVTKVTPVIMLTTRIISALLEGNGTPLHMRDWETSVAATWLLAGKNEARVSKKKKKNLLNISVLLHDVCMHAETSACRVVFVQKQVRRSSRAHSADASLGVEQLILKQWR